MDWLKNILEQMKGSEADAIIEAVKKAIPEHFVAKADFNIKNEALKALQNDIKKRDKDLEELRKSADGNSDLQQQFDTLRAAYDSEKSAYEDRLKEIQISTALKLALNEKVHDADLVAGLLQRDKIEFAEDGAIKAGLSEQLEDLKKNKSFLFVQETAPTISGVKPADGAPQTTFAGDVDSIGARLGKQQSKTVKTENPYFK